MATQSEIAVRVTHLLMMENEMLYKWSYKQKSYGLYGRRISDLDRIRREVEKVTNADICATDRLGTTITARRIFIFLCYTTMVAPNMSSIARYLGLVSHATVLHHKNKMKELIEIQDYESTLLLKQICQNLNIQFLKANQID